MNDRIVRAVLCGLCLSVATAVTGAELPKPGPDGWINLFNGKDLTGWNGDPAVWRVENGYISGKAEKVGHNTFLIYERPLANFVLEAKFVLVDGKGNSGIQYRSKVLDPAKWIVGGYQADIGANYFGMLYEERGRGIVVKPVPEALKSIKPDNDWNQFVITAKSNVVKQSLNGIDTVDFTDTDEAKRAMEGVIALQYHAPGGFEIRFKDIRVKLLPQ